MGVDAMNNRFAVAACALATITGERGVWGPRIAAKKISLE